MLDKPVILQIIPALETGGAERTVVEVAEAITFAGGVALVVCEGGRLASELEAVGGELIPFPAATKNPAKLITNASKLASIIRTRGVHLIHARSRAPAWSAYLAARRTKIPFVTTYHGIYNQKNALKAWYNGVMARGDMVIANSHYTAGLVVARHHVSADRLIVIQRGVDLARFSPEAISAERLAALRAAWGVEPDTRLVVQAARLTRWKGQHVLVGAAARLKDVADLNDVVFILAGDDQGRTAYTQELTERIDALGMTGRIKLTGHCDDVPAAFLAASVGVVPSTEEEAFGRASAEAQAMGCPVIVSNLGALPETLGVGKNGTHQSTGWTFETGNETVLASRIEGALRLSKDVVEGMRNAARVHIAANFSKTVLQSKTLHVYDGLIGTHLAEAFDTASDAVDFLPACNLKST
jgi:glycosyltransferase involved in cell wall biosynthesis